MTAPEPAVDPIAALLHVTDAAVRGHLVAPGVARWLSDGVKAYLNGEVSLDRALKLAGSGWRARTQYAYRVRNDRLRRACQALGSDPGRLAEAVRRFEAVTWPRWRDLAAPPAIATDVQRELFAAFRTGAPAPRSSRQLRRICTE